MLPAATTSAVMLPGDEVRWWHVCGTLAGLVGIIALIANGGAEAAPDRGPATPYLAASAVAAAAWALYSILNRRYSEVPSAAMGASMA